MRLAGFLPEGCAEVVGGLLWPNLGTLISVLAGDLTLPCFPAVGVVCSVASLTASQG